MSIAHSISSLPLEIAPQVSGEAFGSSVGGKAPRVSGEAFGSLDKW